MLIVDDDREQRETIADYLGAEGLDTIEASTAAEARRHVGLAALILLDIGLPDAEGLGLAAEFRAQTANPILLMSGRGHTIAREAGLATGANDYLHKPFQLRELLALVRRLLASGA